MSSSPVSSSVPGSSTPRSHSKSGNSASYKKPKKLNRNQLARARSSAVAAPVSLKSQIRSIKRLLARPNLYAEIREAKEIELKILEEQLEERANNQKIAKIEGKYKKIKFFERQKVVRKLSKLQKQLSGMQSDSRGISEQERNIREEMEKCELDLDYIDYYPRGMKYVALFADPAKKAAVQSDAEEGQAKPQRQLAEEEIEKQRREAEEKRAEIRAMVAKNKARATMKARKAEYEKNAPGKKKLIKQDDLFQLAEDEQQDDSEQDDDENDGGRHGRQHKKQPFQRHQSDRPSRPDSARGEWDSGQHAKWAGKKVEFGQEQTNENKQNGNDRRQEKRGVKRDREDSGFDHRDSSAGDQLNSKARKGKIWDRKANKQGKTEQTTEQHKQTDKKVEKEQPAPRQPKSHSDKKASEHPVKDSRTAESASEQANAESKRKRSRGNKRKSVDDSEPTEKSDKEETSARDDQRKENKAAKSADEGGEQPSKRIRKRKKKSAAAAGSSEADGEREADEKQFKQQQEQKKKEIVSDIFKSSRNDSDSD